MAFLNESEIWPGLVLNMSSKSTVGRLIRFALRRGFRDLRKKYPILLENTCPNHDAIIVEHDGKLCVGEAAFPVATVRSLDEFNGWVESGNQFNVRLLEAKGMTKRKQKQAADYWIENIKGTLYDFKAIPFLAAKGLLGEWFPIVDQWQWAFFCTEGVADSYMFGTGNPIWRKKLPTPLTTLKRYCEGDFREFKHSY